METTDDYRDRSSWVVGGRLMLGLGVGFFFLPGSPFAFVGCLLGGLGLGLLVTPFISKWYDRSSWAIGGGLMLGLGVGFFFMPENIFVFVGCLLGGIGLGLLMTATTRPKRV